MSEFNISVDGGSSVRLPTAGKYCDRDIIVTAIGGGDDGGNVAAQIVDGSITEYRDDSLTSIRSYGLRGCTALETVELPEVAEIGVNGFYGCSALKKVVFPKVTAIKSNTFNGCTELEYADFSNIESIASNAFNDCENLTTLIIRSSSVCALANVNAFGRTPISEDFGEIYVPAALVDEYRNASNWSALYEEETCDFYPIEGSEYE